MQLHKQAIGRASRSFALAGLCSALLLSGCAELPDARPVPAMKDAAMLASSDSFAAPAGDWPQERWWRSYGDAQLEALIDEALADAPDMATASARLQQAESVVRVAGAASKPQLSANAAFSQDKLSYNYLTPPGITPHGGNDYGRVTLDLRWDLDFWGRNRAALAAATSARDASAAELAQTRLLLASGIAANYAELARLYAGRDTAEKSVALRAKTAALFAERFSNGLENRGGMREADARLAAAQGAVLALDEQIALQRNRLAALLGAGPDRGLRVGDGGRDPDEFHAAATTSVTRITTATTTAAIPASSRRVCRSGRTADRRGRSLSWRSPATKRELNSSTYSWPSSPRYSA